MLTATDIETEYDARPFELIERRLDRARTALEAAPIEVLATALQLSSINSLISANTNVEAHERATVAVWNALQNGARSTTELAQAVNQRSPDGKHAVMYYNQKAKAIRHNLFTIDWVELANCLLDEGMQSCQQQLVRRVKGLKNRKAGFTLANLGWTNACCIDSVMARAFDVQTGTTDGRWSAKHPFDTVVTERYYDRIDQLRDETGPVGTELDRYIWQWAAWSVTRRNGFTVHDIWFLLLDDLLDIDVFQPAHATQGTSQQAADD